MTSSLCTHQRAEFNNQFRWHVGDAFQHRFDRIARRIHPIRMDEPQTVNAIEASARLNQQHGFQYIITMNSDRIPYHDFSAGFDFDRHVIQPHLTDETETGGLFGFRFLQ